ncbi:hypothetical protein DESAMIL20_1406 [Desulfurella amilsii]|uniref:Uncharacterized protein n=1 Tax=Desulfurella amilsii TaxID=1562698 RepID=A0A1X4XWE0_9BACT|nr:hypothetical protein DESAMIL20_1406 [Desulfurella amilsii]
MYKCHLKNFIKSFPNPKIAAPTKYIVSKYSKDCTAFLKSAKKPIAETIRNNSASKIKNFLN